MKAAWDAPDSHISVAKRLNSEIPNSHILDQYRNPSNPMAHYDGTAEEILSQVKSGGHTTIDMLVCGAGTGGTITGIAKKLKEVHSNIKVVGVDPMGSILALPDELNDSKRLDPYQVEGIGYDFVPEVLDRSLIDVWKKSTDLDSLIMMRRLMREEGLLCGGSCGAAVYCALEAAESLDEHQVCVVVLPDSVRNYMTKSLSDDWMLDHGFVDNDIIKRKEFQTWWAKKRVCDLQMATPLTITSEVTCKDAIALLKEEGFDMVPVLGSEGNVMGVVTEGNISSMILSGRTKPEASVSEAKVIFKTFKKYNMNDFLGDVAVGLDHEPFALVITEQRCYNGETRGMKTRAVVSGIVTRIDLLDFVSKGTGESKIGST